MGVRGEGREGCVCVCVCVCVLGSQLCVFAFRME